MEVGVQSCDGFEMPARCQIAIRVGETVKQGRYEPQRCYHFPQVDRRRHAKIDIFQHLGTCSLTLDPEAKAPQEVTVKTSDLAAPPLRLQVAARSKAGEEQKEPRELGKTTKSRAKEYLLKHGIEEKLAQAVKALLKEQPEDPMDFVCRFLSDGRLCKEALEAAEGRGADVRPKACDSGGTPKGDAPPEVEERRARAPPTQPPAGEVAKTSDLRAVRRHVCKGLAKAAEEGRLGRALALAGQGGALWQRGGARLQDASASGLPSRGPEVQAVREVSLTSKVGAEASPCPQDMGPYQRAQG